MKKLTVLVEGKKDHDLVDALNEVIRLIKGGFSSGLDSNEDGSYSFQVKK